MQNYNFKILVRIWHPDIDPILITRELGIEPLRTCKTGERRTTPKGTLLDGSYGESYWYTDPYKRGECSSTDYLAEDLVEETISLLEPHKEFLVKLRSEGARVHLQVSSYSDRNYTIELSPEALSRLSVLGVTFVHDVYP